MLRWTADRWAVTMERCLYTDISRVVKCKLRLLRECVVLWRRDNGEKAQVEFTALKSSKI